MNKDDIIRMARKCQLLDGLAVVESQVERFAALVAAAEREVCARLCESHACTCLWNDEMQAYAAEPLANAIRARSQQ